MSDKIEKFKTEKRTTTRLRLLVIATITLSFTNRECCGKLLQIPMNTTVPEGDRAVLQCQTDQPLTVFWYFNNKEVFYGGKISLEYSSKFGIEIKSASSGTYYNLVIPNVNTWYNGLYTCGDDEGQGEKQSAWLTVTDSPTTVEPVPLPATDSSMQTIIIIGAIAGAIVVIGVVILICCILKKRSQNQNETLKDTRTIQKPEGRVFETENWTVNVKGRVKEMEERDAAAKNAEKALSQKRGLKPKKNKNENKNSTTHPRPAPGQRPAPAVLEKVESGDQTQGSTTIASAPETENEKEGIVRETENEQLESVDESEINEIIDAEPGNAPLTSDLSQVFENAESNSTHTLDDALLEDDSEYALLGQSSPQNQTSEQKKGEDDIKEEKAASDGENDAEEPLVPKTETPTDNSSGT